MERYTIKGNVISAKNVFLGKFSEVLGSVKAYGSISMEANSKVKSSLTCSGELQLGEGAAIDGAVNVGKGITRVPVSEQKILVEEVEVAYSKLR